MTPLVSAIIPTYNYARYLGEAVESVLAQTYQNIETIVVDDGSSDGSLELLDAYKHRIKVVRQKNAGVSVARNRGVAESNGEFIAFLDADDVWKPEKITRQIEAFEQFPDSGIVHVGVTDIDSGGREIETHLGGMEGNVADSFLYFERPVILGGGSGVMMPRHVFEAAGGFDETLSTSADWDLYFRISSKFRVAFVGEPLLEYRIHGSNMHSNVARMEREMLSAFGKALSVKDQRREPAFGNLNRVLAGSYFRAGQYGDFLRTAAKSVWYRPSGIGYFVAFPIRKLRRKS